MEATACLIRPLVTEKTGRLQHTRNAYTFLVNPHATKPDIKAAVRKLYNVEVADVRTLVRKAKAKRTKTGYKQASPTKRAIVVLAGEAKIDLF